MNVTPEWLAERRKQHSDVPCGTCTACCKQDRITLYPRDDLSLYAWHVENGLRVLDRKPNGECIYLTDKGCGVHANRPELCRRFDCRVLFLTTPKDKRRLRIEQNQTMREVYAAGRTRLDTLAHSPRTLA